MSALKDGPKWRVLQRWPKAHALKQQRTGHWKVFTGKRCIGEGTSVSAAWADAARRMR